MQSPKLTLLYIMYIFHSMSSLLKIFMCFMAALEILIIFCSRYMYLYLFDGFVLGILELARCILSIWLLILRLYKDSINLKIVNISSYPSNLWFFFFVNILVGSWSPKTQQISNNCIVCSCTCLSCAPIVAQDGRVGMPIHWRLLGSFFFILLSLV